MERSAVSAMTVLGVAGNHLAGYMEKDHIWDEARQTHTEPKDGARGEPGGRM